MRNPFNPFEIWQASLTAVTMTAEANMVIAMRVAGFAGLWNVTDAENGRMVSEKTAAAKASGIAAVAAMMRGASPARVALAAMKPVQQRTRANVKRLVKRGPGSKAQGRP